MSDDMIGHNRPDYATTITASLPIDFQHRLQAIEQFEASALDLPEVIEDDAGDARISDFIADMRTTYKAIEAERVDEKEAFIKAERAVDGFFQPAKRRIEELSARLTRRLTDYKQRKLAEARRIREEEERRAREAAEKARVEQEEAERRAEASRRKDHAAIHNRQADDAAFRRQDEERKANEAATAVAAAPAKTVNVRTERGALSGLKTEWTGVVEDYGAVPLDMLRPYIAQDVIDRAVKAFAKNGGRQLTGCRIFEESKARVR